MKLVNLKIRYWPAQFSGFMHSSLQVFTTTLLVLCTFTLSAQVNDTVVDNTGETLIGVNILVDYGNCKKR